ncbi:MAG: MarR family transcriptional regulator [Nocardioides sp.]|uniref:MarR family winged helix-turn-helix transcriptional regulator n=1 Tax=Nocardioides sp. TaxID=35761 RepID=UPI0039E33C86
MTHRQSPTGVAQARAGLDLGDIAPTDALVQIAFTVEGVLSRVAADNDLSLTQMRVLGILRDRTPRMAQLAGFLGLEKSTMSGLIGRAERRGLVERAPSDEDARATEVVLTESGRELARRVERQVHEALGPVLGRLGDADHEALVRVTRLLQGGTGPERASGKVSG